ncbi:uncharacterized protein LOC105434653 isoform X2 [Cucumis sativus]|uniref:uncharacterized protein LOC105434653 isoform X2 n=1 Tax=Cucumis sativus TaxID=3659 RepID=UPI0005ED098E|nr:uncharacterized protein LOC105434653 isoform X2 [Cucumis sativus]KAE8652133.1 hypothetical protein Csa_022545 [Cucumis sativus]
MSILSISSSSTYFGLPTIRSHHPHRHGSNLNLTHLHNHNSLPLIPTTKTNPKSSTCTRNMAIYSADSIIGLPSLPPFHDTPSPLWIAGVVLSAVLSIWKTKNYWKPFLTLKEKMDKVVEKAEDVAEMAGSAADKVDKAAEDIAAYLPDGSELQKTAESVDDVAEKIGKDADMAGDLFEKFKTAEDELSSLVDHSGESNEEDDLKQKND